MSDRKLQVAFVAGPVYDPLYQTLPAFERTTGIQVDIAHRNPHPQLNAHLAGLNDVPYHLLSTHTKYAPSQLAFLAPLDTIAAQFDITAFYRPLVDLATIEGHLFGIPRNLDLKLLHYRTDLIPTPPRTWDELADTAQNLSNHQIFGFVFPGMESGLFGMFYELAEMGGARLFPPSRKPSLDNQGGAWALHLIRDLYRSRAVPPELIHWHYDEVHRFFLHGRAAMICDYPGYYRAYRDPTHSRVHDSFALARLPAGPTGIHQAYSGSHTFALTKRGLENPAAVELLRFLTAPEQQLLEARQGSVPARPAILNQVVAAATGPEAERWQLLQHAIAHDMLIPPRLPYYPEIEEILWRTVRSAMLAEISPTDALQSMEQRVAACHARHATSV